MSLHMSFTVENYIFAKIYLHYQNKNQNIDSNFCIWKELKCCWCCPEDYCVSSQLVDAYSIVYLRKENLTVSVRDKIRSRKLCQ